MANDMNLSEVQRLTSDVEYLVLSLRRLHENFPDSERLVQRLENASARVETSIQHGVHKLEGVMIDLDYTHIDKTLASAVQRQMGAVVSAMDSLNRRYNALQEVQKKTDDSINNTGNLLDRLDEQIEELHKEAKFIPAIERERMVFAAAAGFAAGTICLYALSLITWLPMPYFATKEQSALLQMVQDETLRLEKSFSDSIQVRIDYDAPANTNNNTGETK